ncbi:uncharacterized protein DC041_0010097 [Schistosoma bovis]|uniref:Uncharacterized protein n=1 Tax=Schistosoma bovis TaxID=6184 RepID=A0A430PXZ0_SCHBO|nr:uncharacterized protein DC041_0010097 [Schistosoma bovis]
MFNQLFHLLIIVQQLYVIINGLHLYSYYKLLDFFYHVLFGDYFR